MGASGETFKNLGLDNPKRCYRLGIMGGTFDPIHIGHLACAEQVRDNFDLEGVIFIPTGNPVFKQNQQVTSARQRLEMCRLACASNPSFDVSSLEVDRGGKTYTIDTLRHLRDYYSNNVELYFISGADAIYNILQWKDSAEIATLAKLIAVTRPGYSLTDEQKQHLDNYSEFSITYTEVTALSISSSDLRQRVCEGKSIRYLTMQSVFDYIEHKQLYRNCAR